ncbi:heterokaryon incompatibility protein-domain-containing protein [Schizothecium vesticola]|uniref:Heterokaryon incompatibility protein-domain-containing protein n=1 Tax=Schizothecium vesticola TaxID=314040 RepID=A0AA40EUC0_9PEZI|nr:heterokaryon incompatibility protein-domain-containing protein [Schizothecium vesticola]
MSSSGSLDEGHLCPICGDLARWTLKVDHVKLQESAAAKDCVGCMLLLEALNQYDVDLSSLVYSDDIMSKDFGGRSLILSGEGYPRVLVGDDLDIEIYASAGDDEPPLGLVQATEVHASTASEDTMSQISGWLQDCTDNHRDGTGCPPNLNVPLPTRLLQVDPPSSTLSHEDSVRLVETPLGATGSFACLSHCWGLKPLLRTLTSNCADHKSGIHFSSLPPTFRDAIAITRSLGIPYLWIDSLCIIQDDAGDWEREAAQMARIYQNGRVTITASNSEGSDGGCFADATRYLSKPLVVVDSQGKTHRALARVKIEHGGWPVLDRGWIFQERLLSPRVLHFGHAEVVWECFGALACGCGRVGAGEFQRLDFMKGKKTMQDQWTVSPDYADLTGAGLSKGWMVAKWRELVTSYSRLRLTYLKDLFPALSGSARQLQRLRGGVRYLAGLWEDTLVEDLLWQGQEVWSPRPEEWHAPTWSWAAVSGGAFAHLHRGTGVDYTEFWLLSDMTRTFVTVEEVEVTPRGIDPTGEIAKAHLVLTGPVVMARMRREFGEYSVGDLVQTGHQEGDGEDELSKAFKVHFDYSLVAEGRGFVPDMALVSCLKMVSAAGDGNDWSKRGQVFYLVLRWVEEPEPAFERIGIASCSVDSAARLEKLEEVKTLRIV